MEKFLQALKERASFFLIELPHFKPFSAILRTDGKIVDVISDPQSYSLEAVYSRLTKRMQLDLKNIDTQASAIVLSGKTDGYDTVVIEVFTIHQSKYQAVFPYVINGDVVTFRTDLNKRYHTITD